MYFTTIPTSFSSGPSHSGYLPTTTSSWTTTTSSPSIGVPVTSVSEPIFGSSSPAFSWAHTVPTFMPWMVKSDGESKSPVMRFTAPMPPDPCTSQTATSWELLHNLGANRSNMNQHLKRRCEGADEEVRPYKQYISEEKMAARLNELHISNEYSMPVENDPFASPPVISPTQNEVNHKIQKPKTLQELEAMLAEELSEDSDTEDNRPCKGGLVLSPELKKLVEPDRLFARTLIAGIERPTMAVVLWQPPGDIIRNKIVNTFESLGSTSSKTKVSFSSSTSSSTPSSSSSSSSTSSSSDSFVRTTLFPETNNNTLATDMNAAPVVSSPEQITHPSTVGPQPTNVINSLNSYISASSMIDELDDDMDL